MNKKSSIMQISLLLIQCVFTASIIGAFTCWFRNGMDLIGTILFLMYLGLSAAAWIPTHILYLRANLKKKDTRIERNACLISTAVVIIISLSSLKLILGRFYPPLEGGVLQDRHRHFSIEDGREVEWWVEFVNPFNEGHKERLVLLDNGKKRVVKMTLLDRKGRFTYKKSEEDPYLKRVGSNILLTSRLELSRHTRFVLFDYESGSVISNWVEEIQLKPTKESKSNQNLQPTSLPARDEVNVQGEVG